MRLRRVNVAMRSILCLLVCLFAALATGCGWGLRPADRPPETQPQAEVPADRTWDATVDPKHQLWFPVVAQTNEPLFAQPLAAVRILAVVADGKNIEPAAGSSTVEPVMETVVAHGPEFIYLWHDNALSGKDGAFALHSFRDGPLNGDTVRYLVPKTAKEVLITCRVFMPRRRPPSPCGSTATPAKVIEPARGWRASSGPPRCGRVEKDGLV